MFERPRAGERAVLVHLKSDPTSERGRAGEFEELARSAGALPVARVESKRKIPDPRYCLGSGKVDELGLLVASSGAELVLVDHELSPGQERNLEQHLKCRVLDRVGLILDIFAQRASSFEGKLQVELAQLRHLSTRLVRGWTHLERQKGGIGLRGPGEKQLETDRRLLGERIKTINKRLARVEQQRGLSRRSRERAELPVIALVGYTNAGKSTLFNSLTGASVGAADRLFQTLDPTLRRLELDAHCQAVLADTVGFVRDLPHDLVAAFKATLEETRSAALLLHVVDSSDPRRRAKIDEVNNVLAELGGEDVPQLVVYNKTDLLNGQAPDMAAETGAPHRVDRDESGQPWRVWMSANDYTGLEHLRGAIAELVRPVISRHRLKLPLNAGRLRSKLFDLGVVRQESIADDGTWLLEVDINETALAQLCRGEGLSPEYIAA